MLLVGENMSKKLGVLSAIIGLVTVAMSMPVSAHVVVKPSEVTTADFQTFSVSVPNEKDQPVTALKLVIPGGLKYVTPTQKSGWAIEEQKSGTGETATVTAISWTGGSIGVGLRDDFTFSAKTPDTPTQLQWKAYQTYADGTVVAWDQATQSDEEGSNTGPFSVTQVVNETADQAAVNKAAQSATDAQKTAQWALYIAVAGVILGLVAIALATRTGKK